MPGTPRNPAVGFVDERLMWGIVRRYAAFAEGMQQGPRKHRYL